MRAVTWVGIATLLVLLVGARRVQPVGGALWMWLGAGIGLQALGDAVYASYELQGVEPPLPGVADVVYLAGYPALFVFAMVCVAVAALVLIPIKSVR